MYHFMYYQPNKDKRGDCVVRALTKVLNKTWLEVFDDLCEIARKKQCMPNDKKAYEKVLKDNGFAWQGIKVQKGDTRPTVSDFGNTVAEHNKIYVLSVANHLVAADSERYYDSWDSGRKSVYGYYYKEVGGGNELL